MRLKALGKVALACFSVLALTSLFLAVMVFLPAGTLSTPTANTQANAAAVTPTPEPTAVILPTATPEPTATLAPTATIAPTATPAPTVTPMPTATPSPDKDDVIAWGLVGEPPVAGKWIDVNLTDGFTRLMDNRKLVKALPSAWGYGETGTTTDWFATVPGTYFVYQRYEYLWFDATYSQKWIRSFVGFDPERTNGFHSFLMDNKGNVIDKSLGAVTHGCIRVEDWKAVYDFSAIGMPVVVHTQAINEAIRK